MPREASGGSPEAWGDSTGLLNVAPRVLSCGSPSDSGALMNEPLIQGAETHPLYHCPGQTAPFSLKLQNPT